MTQKIIGIISDATEIMQYTKRDGSLSCKCTMRITANSNEAHPQEVAVSVTGDNTNYAQCKGMLVEVEYVNRVFEFVKDGRRRLGNDVFLYSIKQLNQQDVPDNSVKTVEE